MIIKEKNEEWGAYLSRLYKYSIPNPELSVRTVTFQVTDDCPCACTYCYQINKGHHMMTEEIAKKAVDLLFDMYDKNDFNLPINKNTFGVVLDFIGGEPLANVRIIDYICTYFMETCIKRDYPWQYTWRASMISNGALYFNDDVQKFLSKFKNFVCFGITLDGPKEIHNACRIYHNGHGNFDDAYAAMKHYRDHYNDIPTTKVTIAKENLHNVNRIIDFFIDEGLTTINGNCTFEAEWNIDDAKLFYQELKKMADKLLELNNPDIFVSLFTPSMFKPLSESNNDNWCGGTGKMIAFDPEGIAYPCIRYMPSSLGTDREPITIGSVDGIYQTDKDKDTYKCLECITRRSQSTDECWNCPIAAGCAWCSGWNYQLYGTPDKRCTRICVMHKARSLANVYYWNKFYKKHDIDETMHLYLPKEDALQIISEDEYKMLEEISR